MPEKRRRTIITIRDTMARAIAPVIVTAVLLVLLLACAPRPVDNTISNKLQYCMDSLEDAKRDLRVASKNLDIEETSRDEYKDLLNRTNIEISSAKKSQRSTKKLEEKRDSYLSRIERIEEDIRRYQEDVIRYQDIFESFQNLCWDVVEKAEPNDCQKLRAEAHRRLESVRSDLARKNRDLNSAERRLVEAEEQNRTSRIAERQVDVKNAKEDLRESKDLRRSAELLEEQVKIKCQ